MIYYAEDENGIRELVIYTLKNTGFEAAGFPDGAALLEAVKTSPPTLILLDIMLPGESGIDILKKLRADQFTAQIPVIMVTAKTSEYDRVSGLECGADDYISKPFGMMEMVARIRAVLRRTETSGESDVYTAGSITVDRSRHTVTVNKRAVELTLKEFALLCELMKNKGIVLTRDVLLGRIWGYNFDGETRTVDVHIRTLRSKLGKGGDIIETVRGVGYKIN